MFDRRNSILTMIAILGVGAGLLAFPQFMAHLNPGFRSSGALADHTIRMNATVIGMGLCFTTSALAGVLLFLSRKRGLRMEPHLAMALGLALVWLVYFVAYLPKGALFPDTLFSKHSQSSFDVSLLIVALASLLQTLLAAGSAWLSLTQPKEALEHPQNDESWDDLENI